MLPDFPLGEELFLFKTIRFRQRPPGEAALTAAAAVAVVAVAVVVVAAAVAFYDAPWRSG